MKYRFRAILGVSRVFRVLPASVKNVSATLRRGRERPVAAVGGPVAQRPGRAEARHDEESGRIEQGNP
jgi:hypothetical protein